ncbi:MAG: GGDEF domain-containing protein [Saccharothrix sp.]|nr:GGDEF domain-containing protein [Saccharothrix sp.]
MREFHRAVLERGDAAVLLLDADDLAVRWASPAATRLFGTVSGAFPDLVVPEDAAPVATFLHGASPRASRGTCTIPVAGSTVRHVDLVVRDLRDDPAVGGLVVVAQDVTGWAERAARLGAALSTDALTGLTSRAGLLPRLEQAVRGGPGPALVFLDLDGFKEVNDRLGHGAGDEVLRRVGARLAALVTGRGTAARLGGDEFAVLLDGTAEPEARVVAEELVAAIGEPFEVAGERVSVTVSAGVVAVRRGHQVEDLLRDADVAMYRAKAAGRARAVVYHDDLRDWALAHKLDLDALTGELERLRRERRALVEAATTDQRTGLPNSAAFDADHARLNGSTRRYCLLIADVDRFHSYNTHYRYLAGHEALRRVGEAIATAVPAPGRAYRYGGEEFAVLLPRTRLAEATDLAERVRAAVLDLGIEHRGSPSGVVTVSVGAVQVDEGATVADAVEEASIALLEAKDAGRNRVVARRTR